MVVLVGAAYAFLVGIPVILQRTVLPLLTADDPSLGPRFRAHRALIESWWERPVLGHGAGAARMVKARGRGLSGRGVWAGNAEIHLLHDSGLLGLASFLLVIAAVCREIRHRLARGRDADWVTLGAPLAWGGVGLLLAFQFTHGLWVMYPYVHLGLLVAELRAGPSPLISG